MQTNDSFICEPNIPIFVFSKMPEDIMIYQQLNCMCLKLGSPNIIAIMVAYLVVILPLNVLVLHLTHQQWRRPSSAAVAAQSDLITVHTSIMELMNIVGTVLTSSGVYSHTPYVVVVGLLPGMVNMNAVMLFHTLTCVERYLAVVHPIAYLGLKNAKGIRIRNINIGAIWMMSFGGCMTLILTILPFTVISLFSISFNLVVVCFCSLSVLCALVRPGPADRFGRRQQVDQSKLRAFHTIMIILCVLLFKFGGYILCFALYVTQVLSNTEKCYLWTSLFWFCLPSNLVLPLLFLHRAGKLCCCKTRQQSD
ncbi:hypothetical protein JOB18_028815 [Solea senegalensis]|uniref:G-protein coupled receptors family 1 profile domain-containing protein n=1 Tax=Solea senegalensis TaxID=28829 RepID=A0AAV6QV80_SOLSE|nr:hypothetical protein JOB18_028815 [Solea senegalensis]